MKKFSGKAPDGYQDFRRVLDRPDIDAIFAPTPDHWHPLMAILGCQAGKDVYVEKPCSPTVAEGRAMVQAARRYGRIVQLGTQQRSMTIFQEAIKLIHSGRLGQITSATCWIGVNGQRVGMSSAPIPEGLDWDMWLGPSPWEPYSPDRQFGFMGCHDYARGGELTNWGVHLMDIVHWGIRQDRPLSVQAVGGSYRGSAGSENYENVDVLWEYPGCTVTWEQRHQNQYLGHTYGIKFQGTEGAASGRPQHVRRAPREPGHSPVRRRAGTKLGPSAAPQQLLREHEDKETPRGRDRARPPIDHSAPARRHRAQDPAEAVLGWRDREVPPRRGRQSLPDPCLPSTLAPLMRKEDRLMRSTQRTWLLSAALMMLLPPFVHASRIDDLVAALAGKNEPARSLARQLLPREGVEVVPKVLPLLKSETAAVRDAAFNVLADVANDASAPGREADRAVVAAR